MANRTRRALLIGSMLFLSAFQPSAGFRYQPEPAVNLDYLVEASDLIVLGELITVERTGAREIVESGKPVKVFIDRVTLRIDEILRGAQESPLVFENISPSQEVGGQQPIYGLSFFRVGENKKITFTNPYNAVLSTPRDLHSRGDTALDRVVSILGDMLMRPGGGNSGALRYLWSGKSKAANGVLRAALNRVADPQLSVQIANGLLLQGDRFCLTFLKQIFLTGPKIPMDEFRELALGNAMALYLKDPEAIPDLEDLLGSPSVHVRRGAAGALRGTQSPKALNGLARALEDGDIEVRYRGVVGLAEVTGQNAWLPTEAMFKSDESRFLTHWKEWARNQ